MTTSWGCASAAQQGKESPAKQATFGRQSGAKLIQQYYRARDRESRRKTEKPQARDGIAALQAHTTKAQAGCAFNVSVSAEC